MSQRREEDEKILTYEVFDDLKPKISVRDLDEEKRVEEESKRRSAASSVSSFKSNQIGSSSKTFGFSTIDKIKNFDTGRTFKSNPKKEDLNGIDPLTPLIFSVVPGNCVLCLMCNSIK